MTITIDRVKLNTAAEALLVAARSAIDGEGRKVMINLPQKAANEPLTPGLPTIFEDRTDYERIQAIAVGAIVALLRQPIAGLHDSFTPATFANVAEEVSP